jgi:putative hydrolase of HD superfamily
VTDQLASLARYLYEAGYLKRTPRTGWNIAGVAAPESVADHSFRVALIAMVLAHMEGGDPGQAAMLGLLHDMPETRIGDVPYLGRAYVRTADPVEVTRDQTAGAPAGLGVLLVGLVAEFEGRGTLEARCAKDADKVECLLQAREYEAAGNRQMQAWVDSSIAGLCTDAGRRLGALCLQVGPDEWWRQVVAEYPTVT